jgi:beta-lactamase class A
VALCIVAIVAAVACSSASDDVGTSAPAPAALDVVLDGLADPAHVDPDDFAPSFLAKAPIAKVRTTFAGFGVGAWSATEVSPFGTDQLTAHIAGPGQPLVLYLAVDDEGRMDDLVFQPDLRDAPPTLGALTEQLSAVGQTAAYLRADIAADGTCTAVAQLDADRAMPIASVAKLYVLGAVAHAIEQGSLTWDTAVPILDELDSLPSGRTQDEPPGSSLSVRELAQRMIERSDNTATDHLIHLVGRPAVEAALGDLGHAHPSMTMPFLSTREMFVIKSDPALLGRYEDADEAERRLLLDTEVVAAPTPTPAALGTAPRALTTVEWFAAPADVCRALVALHGLAAKPELRPIGEILAANPGAIIDRNVVPTVWFKGGSEPGVFFAAWLATRPDGRLRVVAGGVTDPTRNVEGEPTLIQLLARGLVLD